VGLAKPLSLVMTALARELAHLEQKMSFPQSRRVMALLMACQDREPLFPLLVMTALVLVCLVRELLFP